MSLRVVFLFPYSSRRFAVSNPYDRRFVSGTVLQTSKLELLPNDRKKEVWWVRRAR